MKTKVAPKETQHTSLGTLWSASSGTTTTSLSNCVQLPKTEDTFSWTDNTIVLNWITGNPRRFKTYVGNRVCCIVKLTPPNCWNHVEGSENPADCTSHGLLPSELLSRYLWWEGPEWFHLGIHCWPNTDNLSPKQSDEA